MTWKRNKGLEGTCRRRRSAQPGSDMLNLRGVCEAPKGEKSDGQLAGWVRSLGETAEREKQIW